MNWRALHRHPGLAKPGFAAALALLVAAELLLPGPATPPPRVLTAWPATSATIASDATIAQWGATILARPILSPDRRPAPPADASDADTAYTLPRLSAIIIANGTRSAVFSAPGEKPVFVAPGGEIGPYRLESITPDGVKMLGPDGLATLHPQFAASAVGQN